MPRVFPTADTDNIVIMVAAPGNQSGWSILLSRSLPNYHTIQTCQCFPLYLYEEEGGAAESDEQEGEGEQTELLPAGEKRLVRRDAITDAGLAHFAAAYPGQTLTKEELFYYTYGLLHAPSYREKYADNLGKELPRIPRVATYEAFCAFRDAGRALAALHVGFDSEAVPMWPATLETGGKTLTDAHYRVEKMRYAKDDKTTVIYNAHITVRGLPLEAQDYVVNGKPALDWVIERQGVRTDKDSGIVNDANDFATETMGNARYPLELLLRVATVSVETMRIVKGLPGVVG